VRKLRARERRERGDLIDDVEKQRLLEARAPCLNERRLARTGARDAEHGLAKPKRAGPPGTCAPLTVSQNTR
jgi:hypothetical protein